MEKWFKLYENILSVKDLPPRDTEEYRIFSRKTGAPVKIGSSKKHIRLIPKDSKYYPFFQRNEIWWMIPCLLWDGEPVGFILRGFNRKSYVSITPENHTQLLFGWENFADYEKGRPIIFVEGSKDQIILSSVYPYVLGLLASKFADSFYPLIPFLTDKVVLSLDNDDAGRKAMEAQKTTLLKSHGISAKILPPPLGGKDGDWGDLAHLYGTSYLTKYVSSVA